MRSRIIATLPFSVGLTWGVVHVRWPHLIERRAKRWIDAHPNAPVLRLPERAVIPFIRAAGLLFVVLAAYSLLVIWGAIPK